MLLVDAVVVTRVLEGARGAAGCLVAVLPQCTEMLMLCRPALSDAPLVPSCLHPCIGADHHNSFVGNADTEGEGPAAASKAAVAAAKPAGKPAGSPAKPAAAAAAKPASRPSSAAKPASRPSSAAALPAARAAPAAAPASAGTPDEEGDTSDSEPPELEDGELTGACRSVAWLLLCAE